MARLLSIFVLTFFMFCVKIDYGDGTPLIRDYIELAGPNEFPFVVSIGRKKAKNMSEAETHFCGGALITAKHVLTAAHCLNDVETIKKVEIKIGSFDLKKSKKYSIDAWDTFDDWIFRNYKVPEYLRGNDISIITLSKAVNVKPACISDIENHRWIGQTAVTAGWGLNKKGERTRFMEKAVLHILNYAECENKIKRVTLVDKMYEVPLRYLCTNAEPYIVLGCGDSGSPLIVNNNTIIAVNKSTCPNKSKRVCGELNLHVGVDYYTEFIRNITERTQSKYCCRSKM